MQVPLVVALLATLAAVPVPRTLTVTGDTRLLIVAPHPDDEVLVAGGLMRRVHAEGGAVHVAYLTDGDGYRAGVRLEDRRKKPSSGEYRSYGDRRRHEALAALSVLGLDAHDATFLHFPDGGLCRLTRTYWSDGHSAYRSPYTRRDRPPASETLVPDAEYRGQDLTQELAAIIESFRPTVILAPRPEDQHPDHCASWYFTADALREAAREHPDLAPDIVNYIVHFNSWPFEDDRPALDPPALRGGTSGWIRFALTRDELAAKRAALERYRTQMHAMRWFLEGFERSNEVFSRPAPVRVVLPGKRSLCCDQ
jgi:LmbE family N-acetylglucosaminyl deacetylase